MNRLSVDGITADHYDAAIKDLQAVKEQLLSMDRGEAQLGCVICGDNGHVASSCWYHNPLLQALMGHYALVGDFWRCFHCGAVFTDVESAELHFGESMEDVVLCLKQLVQEDA